MASLTGGTDAAEKASCVRARANSAALEVAASTAEGNGLARPQTRGGAERVGSRKCVAPWLAVSRADSWRLGARRGEAHGQQSRQGGRQKGVRERVFYRLQLGDCVAVRCCDECDMCCEQRTRERWCDRDEELARGRGLRLVGMVGLCVARRDTRRCAAGLLLGRKNHRR